MDATIIEYGVFASQKVHGAISSSVRVWRVESVSPILCPSFPHLAAFREFRDTLDFDDVHDAGVLDHHEAMSDWRSCASVNEPWATMDIQNVKWLTVPATWWQSTHLILHELEPTGAPSDARPRVACYNERAGATVASAVASSSGASGQLWRGLAVAFRSQMMRRRPC